MCPDLKELANQLELGHLEQMRCSWGYTWGNLGGQAWLKRGHKNLNGLSKERLVTSPSGRPLLVDQRERRY